MADEVARYTTDHMRRERMAALETLRARMLDHDGTDPVVLEEVERRIHDLGRAARGRGVHVRPPVPLPGPLDGPLAARRVDRGARAEHADQLRVREHHAGGRAGRGLDPRRALPPGADRGRRRRHLGHDDGLARRRLPGIRCGRDRRGGRGRRAAVRRASSRHDPRHGRRRSGGGERRRRPRARTHADLRRARVHDRELGVPRHTARRGAHQQRDGEARGAGRGPRTAPGGHRSGDRLHLPRDVHARPRRQRRRRDPRAARCLRRERRPHRDRQRQGVHRSSDGGGPGGRPGGQGAGDGGRPAGAELPGPRP